MEKIETLLAIIGGVLTILGVVVAVTRYLTKMQDQAEREKVEAINRTLTTRLADVEARRDQLLDQIAIAGKAGNAILYQKSTIDAELQTLMRSFAASGGSIYVPVRSPRGDVHGLAFLSIEPFSAQTQQLKSKVIPLKSLAGRCFEKGESRVVANAAKDSEHFRAADKIANYTPSTTLNLALRDADAVIGVLQLLSKEGEAAFVDADIDRAKAMIDPLVAQVAAITKGPDYLKLLGLGDRAETEEGTVIYFDLSSSSVLFEELSSSFALQLLNEYFEQMCELAFRAGATLDNYMGDGALLRFNVPRPQPDHEYAAVRTALDMNRAFAEMRDYWAAISPQLGRLYNRVGISTGPLLRASLGHSQVQSLTVLGYPIAVAAALCEAGPRDRSAVFVSEETYVAIKDRVVASRIETGTIPKAGRFTTAAYEVTGLR